jgi:hypothetical protein
MTHDKTRSLDDERRFFTLCLTLLGTLLLGCSSVEPSGREAPVRVDKQQQAATLSRQTSGTASKLSLDQKAKGAWGVAPATEVDLTFVRPRAAEHAQLQSALGKRGGVVPALPVLRIVVDVPFTSRAHEVVIGKRRFSEYGMFPGGIVLRLATWEELESLTDAPIFVYDPLVPLPKEPPQNAARLSRQAFQAALDVVTALRSDAELPSLKSVFRFQR